MDGDGKDDLIIGAYGAREAGESYLITAAELAVADAADGTADGVIDLDNVNAQPKSYKFIGAGYDDWSGISVASAGDVDGDGQDDLIIGAKFADGAARDSGKSYLIMAADLAATDAADGTPDGVIDLGNVNAQPGSYQFFGAETADRSGISVASAGDVDGDGRDDLIIGAYGSENFSGKSYVIIAADLAAADAADGVVDGMINLDNVNVQPRSYELVGAEWKDRSGYSVASAGDVDGDGRDDLIVGAPGAERGGSYLVTAADLIAADAADGVLDGVIDLDNVNAQPSSYQFIGAAAYSVASAGDVDGDGRDDLIIGAPYDNGSSGESYLITAADLAATDAADGVVDGVIDLGNVGSAAPLDDYGDDFGEDPIGLLTVGGFVEGRMDASDADDGTFGDKDVFRVSLTQGETYAFTVDPSGGFSHAIFTVRNDSFAEMAISVEGDAGAAVSLPYTAAYTGDHYLRIGSGIEGGEVGTYVVSATEVVAPPVEKDVYPEIVSYAAWLSDAVYTPAGSTDETYAFDDLVATTGGAVLDANALGLVGDKYSFLRFSFAEFMLKNSHPSVFAA